MSFTTPKERADWLYSIERLHLDGAPKGHADYIGRITQDYAELEEAYRSLANAVINLGNTREALVRQARAGIEERAYALERGHDGGVHESSR